MRNIHYQKSQDGHEYAVWPGKSYRAPANQKPGKSEGEETNGEEDDSGKKPLTKVLKKGQIYLGKVVDREKLIFFNRKQGYFRFDPADESFHPVETELIPVVNPQRDMRLHPSLTSMRFGGSWFLNHLIVGIEYDKVIGRITCRNTDTLYALLHYYLLTDTADMHAEVWYAGSFVRFLYPRANLYSQRISDFYQTIGTSDNRIAFLTAHIRYVLESTDDDCAIIIDSTGCQNACSIPLTRVARHESDINIEFRVILVVQRSTGLPLYYETIIGNIVDISTVNRIRRMMAALGLKITAVLGDAGYCCPSNMEKLIFAGSDFMMRLNPTYNLYKKVLSENREKLDASSPVQYRNRNVKVLKVSSTIAEEKDTGKEVKGYVYLCRDIEAYHLKSAQLYARNKKKKDNGLTGDELEKASSILGVFAIVDTEDLAEADVLPAYYMRQQVEQFFDSAKNYGKMMPVRNHEQETIAGHMLMSFISTFLCVLIKNRMNIMDNAYSAVPEQLQQAISEGEEVFSVETADKKETIVKQEPLPDVFQSSPGALFAELELMNAIYFPEKKDIDRKEQIIPDTPHKNAREFMEAFGLRFPDIIMVETDRKLVPIYDDPKKETCSRAKAFARRPISTNETIEKKRRKGKDQAAGDKKAASPDQTKQKEPTKEKKVTAPKQSEKVQIKPEEKASEQTAGTAVPAGSGMKKKTEKRGPGRPAGSKNKKTLAKEAEMAKLAAEGKLPPKRKRGRPAGSKNKSTLAREAEMERLAKEGKLPPKRKRGRPAGSRNKKTLERLAREAAKKQESDAKPE